MRWSAANPPQLEPPADLHLPYGHGLWRVAARWWRSHQPAADGKCRACGLRWPCSGLESAEDVLVALIKLGSAHRHSAPRHANDPP